MQTIFISSKIFKGESINMYVIPELSEQLSKSEFIGNRDLHKNMLFAALHFPKWSIL